MVLVAHISMALIAFCAVAGAISAQRNTPFLPISLVSFVGALLSGIGMQLANGGFSTHGAIMLISFSFFYALSFAKTLASNNR